MKAAQKALRDWGGKALGDKGRIDDKQSRNRGDEGGSAERRDSLRNYDGEESNRGIVTETSRNNMHT